MNTTTTTPPGTGEKPDAVVDRGFITRQLVGLGLTEPVAKSITTVVATEFDDLVRAEITDSRLRRMARKALSQLV